MAVNYNPKSSTRGLVFAIDAANIKSYPGSGTTLFNLSSNKINSPLDGDATYTSVNGGAINLPGSNGRIFPNGTSSQILPMPDLSFEIVFKSPGLGTGMTLGGLVSLNYGMVSHILPDGNLRFEIYDNSSPALLMSSINFNGFDNIWHHVAFVLSGSAGYIYIDGVLNRSAAATIVSRTGTTIWANMQMRFGDNPNNVFYRLKGLISLVKIYNVGLTESEVKQNFNAIRGRYGI